MEKSINGTLSTSEQQPLFQPNVMSTPTIKHKSNQLIESSVNHTPIMSTIATEQTLLPSSSLLGFPPHVPLIQHEQQQYSSKIIALSNQNSILTDNSMFIPILNINSFNNSITQSNGTPLILPSQQQIILQIPFPQQFQTFQQQQLQEQQLQQQQQQSPQRQLKRKKTQTQLPHIEQMPRQGAFRYSQRNYDPHIFDHLKTISPTSSSPTVTSSINGKETV